MIGIAVSDQSRLDGFGDDADNYAENGLRLVSILLACHIR